MLFNKYSIKYKGLINQTLMAQRCVLHLFFNQKYFALVRGVLG